MQVSDKEVAPRVVAHPEARPPTPSEATRKRLGGIPVALRGLLIELARLGVGVCLS